MKFTQKQKKIIAISPIIILAYLASTLLLYDLVFLPQVNKLTGNAVSTVNVSRGPPSNCSFTVYEGENLISFHCISGMYPINFLIYDLTGKYDSIFSYDIADINDPWKSYNPSLPSLVVQDLSYINDNKGYWLMMKTDEPYFFEGILNAYTQSSLNKGWNLIGYPKQTPATVEDAFASIDGKYTMVLQYKRQNDTWYYYIPGDNSSTLSIIELDYGYWINMTEAATWIYP